MAALLEVTSVSKTFVLRASRGGLLVAGNRVDAVKDVSLDVGPAEIVGLVGESGSGKTTLGRCISGLDMPSAGQIFFDGRRVDDLSRRARRDVARHLQVVFQDSYGSLNPRMTVAAVLEEPLRLLTPELTAADRAARIAELTRDVGLSDSLLARRRHQLSGGQQQRVNLARAIITRPKLLVLDEPLSSLDASLAHRTVNLLRELRERHRVGYLFVSHDLGIVAGFCDRVFIMYRGRVVERGPVAAVFANPVHPYTRLLLGARLTTTGPAGSALDRQAARSDRALLARALEERDGGLESPSDAPTRWLPVGPGHDVLEPLLAPSVAAGTPA